MARHIDSTKREEVLEAVGDLEARVEEVLSNADTPMLPNGQSIVEHLLVDGKLDAFCVGIGLARMVRTLLDTGYPQKHPQAFDTIVQALDLYERMVAAGLDIAYKHAPHGDAPAALKG